MPYAITVEHAGRRAEFSAYAGADWSSGPLRDVLYALQGMQPGELQHRELIAAAGNLRDLVMLGEAETVTVGVLNVTVQLVDATTAPDLVTSVHTAQDDARRSRNSAEHPDAVHALRPGD
ncbi:hypothetical protein [Streptomyces sp. SM12]|uniref:hypothetical protein n=1 Tax=Streptomyces sp. SM12 TaxID=1071602 RepID=UPI000CD58524|nr:hypothetical protein [Streptomyces sp. SM12]